MRTLLSVLFLCFSSASALSEGLYGSATIGPAWQKDARGQAVNLLTLSFEPGFHASAAIGKTLGRMKLEGEVSLTRNDTDKETAAGITEKKPGVGKTWAFMLNGLYEMETHSGWAPYLGAGIGYARLSLDVEPTPNFRALDDSADELAIQLLAGVNFQISEQTSLGVGYRYFHMRDVDLVDASGALVRDASGSEFHKFEIKITRRFGSK